MHIHSELAVLSCGKVPFFAARIAPWGITSAFNKSLVWSALVWSALVWSALVSSPLPPLALALFVRHTHDFQPHANRQTSLISREITQAGKRAFWWFWIV